LLLLLKFIYVFFFLFFFSSQQQNKFYSFSHSSTTLLLLSEKQSYFILLNSFLSFFLFCFVVSPSISLLTFIRVHDDYHFISFPLFFYFNVVIRLHTLCVVVYLFHHHFLLYACRHVFFRCSFFAREKDLSENLTSTKYMMKRNKQTFDCFSIDIDFVEICI